MLGYPDAQTDCRESRLLASPLARRANRTGCVRVSRDTAGATFVVTWIVLMPIMSAYMQSATNRLLYLREHEAATATGPPRPT